MSGKASQIGSLLGLGPFELELCRPELLERHPLAWLVSVDGVIIDTRKLPTGLQRQAHEQGLIPFLPRQAK
jgi:hypothetical protein